jgi:hypothetical protein
LLRSALDSGCHIDWIAWMACVDLEGKLSATPATSPQPQQQMTCAEFALWTAPALRVCLELIGECSALVEEVPCWPWI